MRVILIRHGDAMMFSPVGDSGRYLSVLGRQQAVATGRALAAHGVGPGLVWSSPLVRAVQTAELVVAALAFDGVIEARDDLYPDSGSDSLIHALAQLDADQTVIVVGHQPFMSTITSELLGYAVSGFKTGAAYCLAVAEWSPRRIELAWRHPS